MKKKVAHYYLTHTDINHYLNSLLRKPGAIKNSVALKSIPKLKTIYDNHFNTNPRKFIELLIDNKENKEKDLDSIINILEKFVEISDKVLPVDNISIAYSTYAN